MAVTLLILDGFFSLSDFLVGYICSEALIKYSTTSYASLHYLVGH